MPNYFSPVWEISVFVRTANFFLTGSLVVFLLIVSVGWKRPWNGGEKKDGQTYSAPWSRNDYRFARQLRTRMRTTCTLDPAFPFPSTFPSLLLSLLFRRCPRTHATTHTSRFFGIRETSSRAVIFGVIAANRDLDLCTRSRVRANRFWPIDSCLCC